MLNASHDIPAGKCAAIFITQDKDVEASLFSLWQMYRNGMHRDVHFLIPMQSEEVLRDFRADLPPELSYSCVMTPHVFGGMLLGLAEYLGDADTVFFTLADRYPIKPVSAENFAAVRVLAETGKWDGVRFCEWHEEFEPGAEASLPDGTEMRQTKPGTRMGSWHPQFLSRGFFDRLMAKTDAQHGLQNWQDEVMLPIAEDGSRFLVPDTQVTIFEEPIVKGADTLNYVLRLLATTGRDHDPKRNLWSGCAAYANSQTMKYNTFHTTKSAIEVLGRQFPDVPYVVQSIGGVGSKMLVKTLYGGENVQGPEAAHGHWRLPPQRLRAGQSLIYMFGDPIGSALSFFNRRDQRHERHGFGQTAISRDQPIADFALKALKNIEAQQGPLTAADDAVSYLAHGEDLFRIEEHLNNYLYSDRAYPTIFLRYEMLWKHADVLRYLFPRAAALPEFAQRQAKIDTLPYEVADGYRQLYAGQIERQNKLPDVFIMQNGKMQTLA